ncbi:NAD(P)-binding domain-containing protein [Albidovulum inexpectatum]|uniref:NAD(P)-binding domain-containing protein n=1 Tax=Albidovulum inexpectatum TaxID=196587 RepID=UPI0014748E54|nr:NAD(P)-binding domain-containing protein [Albidovulum inexpectatum]
MTETLGIAGSGPFAATFLARLQAGGIDIRPTDELVRNRGNGLQQLSTLLLVPHDLLELEDILIGQSGLARQLPIRSKIVIAADLPPRFVRALRARIPRHVALVDAPFIGSQQDAREGRLTFFLGGEPEPIAALDPLLARLSRRAIHTGEFGTATSAKVLNDFLSAASSALTRVALEWAELQSLDMQAALDIARDALSPSDESSADPARTARVGAESAASMTASIETALDEALAEVHLTPSRRQKRPVAMIRPRAIH